MKVFGKHIFILFAAAILGGAGFVSYGVDFEGAAGSRVSSGFSEVGMVGLSDVGSGASDLQLKLYNILSSTEFDGASVSMLAVTATGDTLFRADASRQCLPASNMKLITTGLALHALGTDYHFATSLAYSGFVEDGILHGDLYIIGGGDPTLGSDNHLAEPLDVLFSQWTDLVREAGIISVDGYVIGDGRAISGMMEEGSWQLDDCGTYYGTGVCGLNFYENRLGFRVSAGVEEGSPLNIQPIYPVMPWMTYSYACATGAVDSGNTLYYYTSNFAPFGEMRGAFAVNLGGKVEMVANKFPEYTAASYFVDYLSTVGIDCSCGPADLGYVFSPNHPPAEDLTIIGVTFSPELNKIARVTNYDSNNMYAETLLRTLGRELSGEGMYDAARNVETELLAGLGVTDGNAVLIDGSGLSRKSHVSAAFLCNFLRAMTFSPVYPDFLASIPSPGSESTLKAVMSSVPAATKRRIHMKSGSMDGVRCYSGYILPAGFTLDTVSGDTEFPASAASATLSETDSSTSATLSDPSVPDDTVIFSILVNNFSCSSAAIRRKIESIILLLTE